MLLPYQLFHCFPACCCLISCFIISLPVVALSVVSLFPCLLLPYQLFHCFPACCCLISCFIVSLPVVALSVVSLFPCLLLPSFQEISSFFSGNKRTSLQLSLPASAATGLTCPFSALATVTVFFLPVIPSLLLASLRMIWVLQSFFLLSSFLCFLSYVPSTAK